MQLAGHLRGRVLLEWNLLGEDEKTFSVATQAVRTCLDPGSRALAAQDFRHMVQRNVEPVADFIRCLERAFRTAYGQATGNRRKAIVPLVGSDLRTPTEAALLPPTPLEAADLQDYREGLVTSLSSAWELAAKSISKAQKKHKASYNRRATESVPSGRLGFGQISPRRVRQGSQVVTLVAWALSDHGVSYS